MAGLLVVVKVGGSLLGWPGLPGSLSAYLGRRPRDRFLLIVGGGGAADWVRGLDRDHGIGDHTAHELALRALDLTAHALAAIVPGLAVVERVEDLGRCRRSGGIPVLAPRGFLDKDERTAADPLPRSWDVTTDAIAARLAVRLGATELALLKSAPLPPGADRTEAARLGLVDPAFPDVARPLGLVTYCDLRGGGAIATLGAGRWQPPGIP